MKKYLVGLLAMASCFSSFVYGQESSTIEVLLSKLEENHMGRVTDVFSPQELQLLKEYFNEDGRNDLGPRNLLLTRRLAASQVVIPVRVVAIDPVDLSELIDFGASPLQEFEGAGFVRGNPPNEAVIIDNTNRVFVRGIINNDFVDNGLVANVPSGEVITGVEPVTARTDQLYGVSTNGVNSSHLLRIDQSNWSAEVIGGNNGLILPIALARDGANNLVTIDIDNDGVYGINSETGVVNFIGNLGYDANFGQGMAFEESSGMILNAAYNMVVGDSELRVINPTTGMSSSLGTINPGSLNQFGWIGPYDEDELSTASFKWNELVIHPNPVIDNLVIEAPQTIQNLRIYGVSGNLIFEKHLGTAAALINLEMLSSGFYILEAESEGITVNRKLIKR